MGIFLITLPFSWTYLLGFFTGTHHTCWDNFDTHKTGLTRNSLTIKESQQKRVFIRKLKSDKDFLHLDSNNKITISNIWVETAWKYECLDTGLAVIPLEIPSILIEVKEYHKLLKSGAQVIAGGKYARFYSKVLLIDTDIVSADSLLLIVTNKDGKETGRLKITN